MNAAAELQTTGVFDDIVCGVDRSEAGRAAARLAARVGTPLGSLVLVSVHDPSIAVHAGWQMAHVASELAEEARSALTEAELEAAPIHPVRTKLLEGDPLHCLLAEIERRDAGLVVVGSHGRSRAAGIALGSVTTYVLHEAPCSVLVARPPRRERMWPRSIAVGIDGSLESALAAAAATELAAHVNTGVQAVIATRDSHIDLDAAYRIAPDLDERDGRAVDVLYLLSQAVDLVVVGSRGLKGVRSLGSVSERVAHDARCPVLVVRPGLAANGDRRRNEGGQQ